MLLDPSDTTSVVDPKLWRSLLSASSLSSECASLLVTGFFGKSAQGTINLLDRCVSLYMPVFSK